MPAPEQLGLPFAVRPALGRSDFLVAPSNEGALRFVERWPDWPVRASALFGPQGAGKSHLVAVWRALSEAVLLAAEDLTLEKVTTYPGASAIAIEDVDLSPATAERDRALMALFERANGVLLLTGRRPPTEWTATIGDLTSRFSSLLALSLSAPDDTLLGNVARKLFADRGLLVPDNVIDRMLRVLERTPPAIAQFVERADAAAMARQRPVTERLVLELLAEP